MKFILVCFHGNRLSSRVCGAVLGLGVLFAGMFQLGAWHCSLVLGSGAGGAGQALQLPLPPAKLWGCRAAAFGN